MSLYIKLFEPGKIGQLEIKNRIIMPAMGNHWTTDGFVTQRHLDYYAERAKGGVGLVTTEGCSVQYPAGKGWQQMSADDDKFLPGLSKLAAIIKQNGARAAIQIHHAGAASPARYLGGLTPVGPSAVHRPNYDQSSALSLTEIDQIRDCFIAAAVRGWKAGFDAVEIHGAHHYLLAQFHSPAWNLRSDDYGVSIINRARLTMGIIKGIKNRLPEFPVICRFNGCEYGAEEYFKTPGLTLQDAIEIAKMAEVSGADAVHISAFGWGKEGLKLAPAHPGELVPLAEAVKKVVLIPVITVGRITPDVGEQVLRDGKADFVSVGRGLLADPYFARKVQENKLEEITPCISCWECLGQPRNNICTVNARNGFEGVYPYPITRAAKTKKVFVIGGGPGGMEAARVAAQRGHDVILFEKNSLLGGKLLVADKPVEKKNLGFLLPFMVRQLEKAGVKVILSTTATPDSIIKAKPDAVVIAIGARSVILDIKGLNASNSIDAIDLLAGEMHVGEKVLIIGGELVGCEVADLLSEQPGKDITLLRRGKEFMTETRVGGVRYALLNRLHERGVKFYPGVTYKYATEKGLSIINKDGKEQFLSADIIILAAGSESDKTLVAELKGKIPEIFVIGDAREPRQILPAIHEGFQAAYAL